MSEGPFNPYRELREAELRSEIIGVLSRAAELEGLKSAPEAQSMVQDYLYSASERRFALELNILELLDRIDEELFHRRDTAPVQSLRSDGSLLAGLIRAQQKLRGREDYEPSASVTVSVPRELIDRLRSEADYMEENSLGVVPGPLADVLKILEGAVKTQTVDTVREFGVDREDSIYSAVAQERGHSERAPMSDQHEAPGGGSKPETSDRWEEEEIPVLEGMLVRGTLPDFGLPEDFLWAVHTVEKGVVELDGVTHPGVGVMVNLEDFWKDFRFAVDVVQPAPVLAVIRELAIEERRERNAQLRDGIAEQLSTGASRVVEGVEKLSERYAPVGERFLKRAVSAAKSAVESVSTKVEEAGSSEPEQKDTSAASGDKPQAKGDQPQGEDERVLSEAFSREDFEAGSDREVDLQALREKLSSTPKAQPKEPESAEELRDRIAGLVYAAQHPDQGSKWLTTVDGSPNVASYAAADALLSEFSGFLASSNGEKNSGAQAGAERSAENSDSKGDSDEFAVEDFPVPVPPAQSDLERLEYLQRSLSLNDFEDSFRKEDALAELLELLPSALEEIDYLRDNEGEVQKGFMDILDRLRGAVSTSSVRRAWESYEEARESRDLIYESRQEERAKVRRLEGEIEELKGKLESSEEDNRSAAEKLAAWTEEADRKEREAINQSSVNSYNRWADRQQEIPLSAGKISYTSAEGQRELGHVSSFMVSGIPMAVRISEQEGTTLKLLELIPQGSESPLFRKEICATGFLTEEKLRRIVTDSDGWLGNDAVEAGDE